MIYLLRSNGVSHWCCQFMQRLFNTWGIDEHAN